MKKAISSYCFDRIIKRGETDQLGCVEKAARLGFDAVEFTDLTPPAGVSEAEYAEKIRLEAEKRKVKISGYSVFADLIGGCDGNIRAETERIMRKIDVAEILGTGLLRHDVSFGFPKGTRGMRGYADVVERFAEACRNITAYAAGKNIRTCTENHGVFSQDSDRVEMLINAVGNDNFGAQIDVGNFLCADEDPACAVGRLAPYAFNVHIKDFIVKREPAIIPDDGFFTSRGGAYLIGTVPGHGDVPIARCVTAIKKAGYDGYLTLEFEGKEELEYALAAGSRYLDALIGKIDA